MHYPSLTNKIKYQQYLNGHQTFKISLIIFFSFLIQFEILAKSNFKDIERFINKNYLNKNLMLRNHCIDSYQYFDDKGTPFNKGKTGTWTLYGVVELEKVKFDNSRLELLGNRVHVNFEPIMDTIKTQNTTTKINLTINIDQASLNEETLKKALANIFLESFDGSYNSLRAYMQSTFKKDYKDVSNRNSSIFKVDPENKLYNWREVSPPKLIYRVEPEYTEIARKKGINGNIELSIIVRKTGYPDTIKVIKSLGYGLDETAIDAISKWKFEPGLKDGVPVDVMLTVEVRFSLRDYNNNPPQKGNRWPY